MTIVYLDADACPVKQEAIRVARRHGRAVKMVCNGGIRPHPDPAVEIVIVAQQADAADIWIADHIEPGDLCITADIVLAASCIEKGAAVLKHNGDRLDQDNIGNALAMRDLLADRRAANPLGAGGGGNPPFSDADRSRFLDMMEREMRVILTGAGGK